MSGWDLDTVFTGPVRKKREFYNGSPLKKKKIKKVLFLLYNNFLKPLTSIASYMPDLYCEQETRNRHQTAAAAISALRKLLTFPLVNCVTFPLAEVNMTGNCVSRRHKAMIGRGSG